MKSKGVMIIIGAALFVLFCGANIKAEQSAGAFSMDPFVGGYLFEGDQELSHKPVYGLGLGYNLDEHFTAEASFSYIDTKSKEHRGDVDGYLYRLDALYHFMPSKRLVPYVAAGVGGITLNPDTGSTDSDFLVNYGAGLKYFLTENMMLRGDLRHLVTFPENNLMYTVGLTYYFGAKKKAVESAPLKDSDGDGVYDDMDRCPDTLQGVKVDKKGCPLDSDGDGVYDYLDQCPDTPAGVSVNRYGCPPDSDGDGLCDYLDQCPNTPKGVKVDERGCSLDSDGDGVYDYLDKCPGTPKGASVDDRGCWVLKNIYFDTNKWDIKPEFYIELDNIVSVLQENPSLKVEIQGYTDNIGSAGYNQKLSEKRANAVMEYLLGKSIAQSKISAAGYGLENPATSNDTPHGRAKNRRIELKPIR